MAIWVNLEQQVRCGGYSGWLRTNMVTFVSAGLGLGHKYFDGYRGKLRSTRILRWLQGLAEDDEYGFCGYEGPVPSISEERGLETNILQHIL